MKHLRFLLVIAVVLAAAVFALELGLRFIVGFGNPIVYDNTFAWGYRPVPNQEVRRAAGKRVRVNNLGLRARRDWPALDDTTRLRLLYLGDSVTWGGTYLDDSETFAERSGERLASVLGRDVLAGNAAVNAWGPLNIKGLTGRLGFMGAKAVVLVVPQDVLDRGMSQIGESPFWNHKPPSALEELLSSWLAYPFGARRYLKKDAFVTAAEVDSFRAATIQVYLEIANRARESDAVVLLVWHPSQSAVAGRKQEPHRERFLEACRRAGYPAVDMTPILRQQSGGGEGLFVDPVHLSSRGHEIYGRVLGDSLARLVRGG